jgi:hypothetical protein
MKCKNDSSKEMLLNYLRCKKIVTMVNMGGKMEKRAKKYGMRKHPI